MTIRGRSFEALGSLGFNKFTLDALADDWSEGGGSSSYVICVEHTPAKSPDNVITGDSTGIVAAQQAIACLRLVARGGVTMGPMWFTRSSRFDVGLGSGRLRGGWPVPTLGRSKYRFTRAIAREVRSLQPDVRYLGEHGYERGPGNLDVALQFFLSSYDRFPARPDSQLVDTITATEAVLGSGIANTFKLAFRVAGMLGRTNAERVQVFDDMRRFYAIRNSIVHGDRLTEAQGQRLGRVDDARDYVRRLLVGVRALGGFLLAYQVHQAVLQGRSRR